VTELELQTRSVDVVDSVPGNEAGDNAILFGDGVLQSEITALLGDTAIIVFPAALLLILGFLVFAYRDPIMTIGLVSLLMALLWTFGFMGYAGIPFSDSLITVFPLLLAVGIDFGIHIVNRYREERGEGLGIGDDADDDDHQLLIAFLLVTITTVFGLVSKRGEPLRSQPGLRDRCRRRDRVHARGLWSVPPRCKGARGPLA